MLTNSIRRHNISSLNPICIKQTVQLKIQIFVFVFFIIFSVYGIVQEYNKWWYIYSENYAEALASNGDKDKLEPIKERQKRF